MSQSVQLGTGALATVQVARKPILAADDQHALLGYELMFSDTGGLFSAFADVDELRATSEVVSHSVLTLGVDAVVGQALAFVRFPRAQVIDSTPLLMPPEQSVLELGPDSWRSRETDDAVLSKVTSYKQAGFQIALTNFAWAPGVEQFVDAADYVKVDLGGQDPGAASEMLAPLRPGETKVIAVGVDTVEARDALDGVPIDFVQGFFFSTPNVVEGRELPGFKTAYLQLLRKAYAVDVDFAELADIVKSDVALSFKLLRFVNSAAFGLRSRVESIEKALVMLGVNNVRRWVSVATVSGLSEPGPQELAVLCATRGRFCEKLGERLGVASPHDCFSVGMFSLVDVMLGKSLTDALADVPLSDAVTAALRGERGPLADLLDIVVAYERGRWETVSRLADANGWPETELISMYIDAIEWSRDFFGTAVA